MFLDHFDVLISKIIFKNKKNIIFLNKKHFKPQPLPYVSNTLRVFGRVPKNFKFFFALNFFALNFSFCFNFFSQKNKKILI